MLKVIVVYDRKEILSVSKEKDKVICIINYYFNITINFEKKFDNTVASELIIIE